MPLVRIKDKYQVTIPASIRKKLGLEVGDVLEAEIEGDKIFLQPQAVIEKSQALKKFLAVLEKIDQKNKDVSDEEVEEDILEAIREVRRQKHAQSRR